jgi:hypothetical protein
MSSPDKRAVGYTPLLSAFGPGEPKYASRFAMEIAADTL